MKRLEAYLNRHGTPGLNAFLAAVAISLTTAVVADGARAASTPEPAVDWPATAATGAATVQIWHAAARNAIAQTRPSQQAALRVLAYLAIAQDDACRSFHAATPERDGDALDALFDRVSADVLAGLVPTRAAAWAQLAAARNAARGDVEPASLVAQAQAIGADTAQRIVERAAQDGFDAPWTGSVPATESTWRSQLQPPRPPHLPQLGQMRPFFLEARDAIELAAPPPIGSTAFAEALAEVRARAVGENRAGIARAKRWEMTSGSLVGGFWDATAAGLALKDGLSGAETARVLALTLGAAMDANILCHAAKYRYWTPRPSQADPAIRPLIALPNHPSYPSNHACDSGAAAEVLAALFPARASALRAMAQDAGESRIDGGIHYRFDIDAGMQVGRAAARAALRTEPHAVASLP